MVRHKNVDSQITNTNIIKKKENQIRPRHGHALIVLVFFKYC